MNVKKSYRYLLIPLFLVFFVGCGGSSDSGGISLEDERTKVLDSKKEIISFNEIKTMLEANETTYQKSISLDDKKNKVEISFDLKENNITEDITIDIEKIDYKKDVFVAELIKITSSKTLKNVDIEIVGKDSNIVKKQENLFSIQENISYSEVLTNHQNIAELINDKPVYVISKSNFLEFIKDLHLKLGNDNKYYFSFKIKKEIKNIFRYKINKESMFKITSNDTSILLKNKNKRYKINFYTSDIFGMPYYEEPVASFVMTTDFITPNSSVWLSKRNLSQTIVNKDDILNNFMESEEINNLALPVLESTTHRISDFDELLKLSNPIPFAWSNSFYGKNPKGDDGRIPLILVHGWNGAKGFREPTKLLLWENSEFHYWHNFLAYYLTSKKLQEKYHIYLYKYPSYKHITYNAKIFKELLNEVSSDTDLGEALNKDDGGVTIMAHSMGGLVSRAMIEEYNGLGSNAEKLKKLITLDTPHHGSRASVEGIINDLVRDLNTHGAMDLNFDNFTESININDFNKRRTNNGLNEFDELYCVDKLGYNSREECMQKTSNPYIKYLSKLLVEKKEIYNKKYILYTALSRIPTRNYNYIANGLDFNLATSWFNNIKLESGGAESVSSSMMFNMDSQLQMPVSLISVSKGKDHPYGLPYRLFWDYDHEMIFNGVSTGRGHWDKYISSNYSNSFKDTRFIKYREDYIQRAIEIRDGNKIKILDKHLSNPLKYEPVFLVLQKDLLGGINSGLIVNAGVDKTVNIYDSVVMSGRVSSSNGSILTYEWTDERGMVLSTEASFSYTPMRLGKNTLTLTVTDNNGFKTSDSVDIYVVDNKISYLNIDFEDYYTGSVYSTDDLTVTFGSPTIMSNYHMNSGKSLLLHNTSIDRYDQIQLELEKASSTYSMNFDMFIPDNNQKSVRLFFDTPEIRTVYFTKKGKLVTYLMDNIKDHDSDVKYPLKVKGTYPQNRWFNVQVDIDLNRENLIFKIDGNEIFSTDFTVEDTDINDIRFSVSKNVKVAIDNIYITN